MVVFDLDPGDGTAMTECAEVALDIRDVLDRPRARAASPRRRARRACSSTCRSTRPHTHDHAATFALAVAQVIEKHHPTLVVTNMTKDAAPGQGASSTGARTAGTRPRSAPTRCGPDRSPTVSTPVTWDEVEAAADGEPLSFEAADVLDRVDEHGDLFAPTATLEQELPTLAAAPA